VGKFGRSDGWDIEGFHLSGGHAMTAGLTVIMVGEYLGRDAKKPAVLIWV
jgi:hypothetical protein